MAGIAQPAAKPGASNTAAKRLMIFDRPITLAAGIPPHLVAKAHHRTAQCGQYDPDYKLTRHVG
jgi:hypothetical protein